MCALARGQARAVRVRQLVMPIMDEWSFGRAQLTHPTLRSIPVIVVSALDPQGAADFAGCPVFRKPIDFDAVLGAIARSGHRCTEAEFDTGASRTRARGIIPPAYAA
jgi:hypothetical protein